jgi:hypothetical protein
MADPDFSLLTEKERSEGIPGLFTPEELALARVAGRQFADQEMMADVQNRIPANSRFSGIYGLLPYLGYTRPPADQKNPDQDYRARIKNTVGGVEGNNVILEYFDNGQTTTTLGGYNPERPEYPVRPSQLENWNKLLRKIGTPEFASSDVAMNALSPKYREQLGLKGLSGTSQQIMMHELTHRATDKTIPMIQDFLSYVNSSEEFDESQKKLINETIVDHKSNEGLSREIDNLMGNPEATPSQSLVLIDEAMRNFLTPQKQKQYGVRLPTPAAVPREEPGLLESIMNRLSFGTSD